MSAACRHRRCGVLRAAGTGLYVLAFAGIWSSLLGVLGWAWRGWALGGGLAAFAGAVACSRRARRCSGMEALIDATREPRVPPGHPERMNGGPESAGDFAAWFAELTEDGS